MLKAFSILVFLGVFAMQSTKLHAQIQANFSFTPASGCSPLRVAFTNLSTGTPDRYEWNFGDGVVSTEANPVRIYSTPGVYSVTLTVYKGVQSSIFTASNAIRVNGITNVDFEGTPIVGCVPVDINFADKSQPGGNPINKWRWDFGDGNLSDLKNPSHRYLLTGLYNVTLTATDAAGCIKTASKTNYINVSNQLEAKFRYTQSQLCNNQFDVQFFDQSLTSGTVTYLWDFGDGSFSAAPNPVHQFSGSSPKSVKLTIRNAFGCESVSQASISPNSGGAISSQFLFDPIVCKGTTAAFVPEYLKGGQRPTSIQWLVSDGTRFSGTTLLKKFTAPGQYTVTQTLGWGACTYATTQTVQVIDNPAGSFNLTIQKNCDFPLTATLNNTSSNGKLLVWSFGNGLTANTETVSTQYFKDSTYTIFMVVENESGCRDTVVKYERIQSNTPNIKRVANFSYSGCVNSTVSFSADVESQSPISEYFWDLGEGTTSTSPTPSKTYTSPGRFPVSLTVKSADGCVIKVLSTVEILVKPKPSFTASALTGCTSTPITFTNTTPLPYSQFVWLFGDKQRSSDKDPVHKFRDLGPLDVTLVAFSGGCTDTLVKKGYVNISAPLALFSANIDCTNPLNVKFSNKHKQGLSFSWNFGDGTNSVLENPSHTFPSLGEYEVILTATNGACTDAFKSTLYLSKPIASVRVDSTRGCFGNLFYLNALPPGEDPSKYKLFRWTLQTENGPYDTITFSPLLTVEYPKGVPASGSLRAFDLFGCEAVTDFSLPPTTLGLKAAFTPLITTICVNNEVEFRDISQSLSKNTVVNRRWVFDAGNHPLDFVDANTPTIKHLYTETGNYNVALYVEDDQGCSDTVTNYFNVAVIRAVVRFSTKDSLVCLNTPVNFVNSSVADTKGRVYTWDFGDGRISNEDRANFSIVYTTPGIYDVKLSVRNDLGCFEELVQPKIVTTGDAKAQFEASSLSAKCPPLEVKFTNQSSYYKEALWDFGNGNTSELIDPTNTYVTSNTYTVSLTVKTPGGCSDVAKKTIFVDGPKGDLRFRVISDCVPAEIEFDGNAQSSISYVWQFDDGIALLGEADQITHIYNQPGTYFPKLVLENESGCIVPISALDPIIVKDTPKIAIDGPSNICQNQAVTLSALGAKTYAWLASPSLSCTQCASPIANPKADEIFIVRGTNEEGCASQTSHSIQVVPKSTLTVSGNQTICEGESLNISAAGFANIRWSPAGEFADPNLPEQTIRPKVTTTYTATGTDEANCFTESLDVLVSVYPIPTVSIDNPLITGQVGSKVPVEVRYSPDVTRYDWQPFRDLSCNNCPNPIATIGNSTEILLIVSNDGGCSAQDVLKIEPFCRSQDVFFPNTFSPNGDGRNDLFYPRGTAGIRINSWQIFNRWGELVFERKNVQLNDLSNAWNGTYKGKPLAPDVFVYVVEGYCPNNQTLSFKGTITLLK